MLSANRLSPRKKRPTPRFKPAMAQAIARTKAARRAGLLPPDCIPSAMPAGRAPYDDQWKAKHGAAYNARRRAARANAKALKTAPTTSPEFYRACIMLCPKDMNPAEFAVRQSMARPAPETQAARDARLTAKEAMIEAARKRAQDRQNARRRQQRAAAKLTAVPQFLFVAT